ncbi:Isoleucine N-monooxygenase 2 [Capsicum chinense]|nr:Isoleucine N-monooxygenase 2 [Capsicum chinense]
MEEMDTEIACIRLGNVHVIPVTSPELAREFLQTQDSVFSSRPICMSASLISTGYLTSVFLPIGDQWMKMRRILASHVLSPASFQWLRTNMTFNYSKLHKYDLSSNYLPWLSLFDLDGHKAIIKKAYATATKHIDAEVDQRIQMGKDGNKTLEADILDVLIMLRDTNGNPLMNDKEIKAQVLELMLAAVDNPSNAVEMTLAEMLNQPKLMQRAVEELNTVVGINRLVQESDLPRLNYLKACIKEAFRLYPITHFNIPHVSVSDTIIGEKYFIPKGSVVLLSRLGLGRNPKDWGDPLKFKPERHLKEVEDGGEVVLTDSKLRLLSFSMGRRGCPAVKLGSTITTMLLARLLQGFTWSSPPNSPCSELIESTKTDHFSTFPLVAHAKPRLAKAMYS